MWLAAAQRFPSDGASISASQAAEQRQRLISQFAKVTGSLILATVGSPGFGAWLIDESCGTAVVFV